ncbi:hypothetical protein SK069_02990 [Patulibacter brassicae]|uniref:LPXTG cell wall anchor domain-containing protein n=1 Tax=Patulibacter brassicae TaxID=1705717 RepID=A0ABU4VFD3_9ACTN|nr:hypothetical protein [Patulibacter brassicae]MDX8150546.1 hypothetical protein [Patulibacter brassicae]
MHGRHRPVVVLLATGVAALVPALPSAAQEPAVGELLRDPPALEAPSSGTRSDDRAPSGRRTEDADRDARATARPHALAETGADLRGLTLLGAALLLGGAGLRLRTSDVRW